MSSSFFSSHARAVVVASVAVAFGAGVVVGAGCSTDAFARFRVTWEDARRELLERAHTSLHPSPDEEPRVLVRRELWAGSRDAIMERVAQLFVARFDVHAIPRDTPLTVWTLGDDVVAAEVHRGGASVMAVPAFSGDVVRFFDESGASLDGRFIARPVAYRYVASGFGTRIDPITKKPSTHSGLDLAADRGAPVVSVGDGVVLAATENKSAGLFVVVQHALGFKTKYFHLDALRVRAGQHVNAGDVVGVVGSTGRATGPHLHFEVSQNGVALDPARVEWPSEKKLAGDDVRAVRDLAAELRAMEPNEVVAHWPPPQRPARVAAESRASLPRS